MGARSRWWSIGMCACAMAVLVAAESAHAQDPDARPTARAVHAAEAPVVDGVLDDAAWQHAPVTGGFVERKPALRATPADATTFQVVFDRQAITFAIRMQDAEPDAIVSKTLTRDSFAIFSDDAISIKLDPHRDFRTTYGFATNPLGARLDYRAVNEGGFKVEVDYVWQAAAQRTDEGWTAEVRIPWAALDLDPSAAPARIGLNFSRDHARRHATYDWSVMPAPYSPVSASLYGDLVGLDQWPEAAADGEGAAPSVVRSWYVQPYALGGFSRARRENGDIATAPAYDGGVDAGVDLAGWQIDLTVNTDFAQVDLDEQVVNLDRFSLFLPEKRDFFLSGLELFAAGSEREIQLLHTRTIGLAAGDEVPILAGVKLTGQPFSGGRVGLLQVTTRPHADEPWTSHLVGRGLYELGGGSNVGVMITHRQSLEDAGEYNLVVAADGAWRSRSTPMVMDAYAAVSIDPRGADETRDEVAAAAGLHGKWRGELFRPSFSYRFVQPDFRSDLGFIRRTDYHRLRGTVEVEPRPGRFGIETISIEASASLLGDAELTALLDWSLSAEVLIDWANGFGVELEADWVSETLTGDFEVGHGTLIEAGTYDGAVYALTAWTPSTWAVSGSATLVARDYFGGQLLGVRGGLTLKPIPQLRVSASGRFDDVTFDDDRAGFRAAVINASAAVGFTPDLGLSQTFGWSLLDERMRFQTRVRWTYLPGSDLFLVYQLDLATSPLSEAFQSLLLKATFRWPWE